MTPAKCPNPECPFLFDPSQVPPGAVIACPRCGLRFTLAPGQPPPMALYGSPSPAEELAFTESRPNTDDLPTEERPRPHRGKNPDKAEDEGPHRKPGSGAGKVILFSVVGVLLICGSLATILILKSRQKPEESSQRANTEVELSKYRLAYKLPPGNWEADDGLKRDFKATVLAMKSSEPLGWVIFDVRDLGHTPGEGELREIVRAILDANGEVRGVPLEEEATLGGVKGRRFVFESLMKSGEDVKGEVYAVGHQGLAYLVYSFAPDKTVDQVAQAFVDFRAGIRFTSPPKKSEQVGFRKVFRTKLGSYALTATENLWVEAGDPTTQHEQGDLWLRGSIKLAGGGTPDPAQVVVIAADKATDAKAIPEMVATFLNPVAMPKVMQELTDDYQGDDPPAGPPEPTTPVQRYEVRYENDTSDSRKFVVVSTLDSGGKKIIVIGYSVLKQRKTWEKRLVQIVGSLSTVQ